MVYGASRVLCGVVIELAARWGQNPAGVGVLSPHYLDMVRIWDGEWYERIALHGYPRTLPHGAVGTVDYNSWAFFPLFPMLVRGRHDDRGVVLGRRLGGQPAGRGRLRRW